MTECAFDGTNWVSAHEPHQHHTGCNSHSLIHCNYCGLEVCFHHRESRVMVVKKAIIAITVCDACIASNAEAAADVCASDSVVKALREIHQCVLTKRAISSE